MFGLGKDPDHYRLQDTIHYYSYRYHKWITVEKGYESDGGREIAIKPLQRNQVTFPECVSYRHWELTQLNLPVQESPLSINPHSIFQFFKPAQNGSSLNLI